MMIDSGLRWIRIKSIKSRRKQLMDARKRRQYLGRATLERVVVMILRMAEWEVLSVKSNSKKYGVMKFRKSRFFLSIFVICIFV